MCSCVCMSGYIISLTYFHDSGEQHGGLHTGDESFLRTHRLILHALCMYVCMYVCMMYTCVCRSDYTYVCTYTCVCKSDYIHDVCMCVYACINVYAGPIICMYVCMHADLYVWTSGLADIFCTRSTSRSMGPMTSLFTSEEKKYEASYRVCMYACVIVK